MRKILLRVLVIFVTISATVACTDSSISSRDTITDTYLFYTTGTTGDYGIHAVDPGNPSSPIEVESVGVAPAADYPIYFLAGTVESSSKSIADLHYRYLLYPRGTNFFRVSADKSEALYKRQVSNENQADNICTGWLLSFDDYIDPNQSALFYTKDPTGLSANCGGVDDRLYMIKLGMPNSVAPIGGALLTNFVPTAAAYDTNGAITGFLVLNQTTGNIELRDTLLANPGAPLLTGVTSAFPMAMDSSGRTVLYVNDMDLHVFNPQTGTISTSLHTEVTSLEQFPMPVDNNYAYFVDGQIIYRIPMDGSGSSSIVVDESGGAGTLEPNFSLSRDRIIYQYDDVAEDYVRSVPVSGGTGTNIFTLPNNPNVRSFRSAAGRIYISASSATNPIAVSVGDDGSNPEVTFGSWWSGFTYNHRQPLFADFDLAGRALGGIGYSRMRAKTIYKVNYSASGNTLSSFDADTTSKLVDYGIPSPDFNIYDGGFGNIFPPIVHGLENNGRTLIFFDGTNSKDVIFLHARHAGSVVRVTNDAVDDNYYGVVGGCSLNGGRFDPLFPVLLTLSAIYLWRRKRVWRS